MKVDNATSHGKLSGWHRVYHRKKTQSRIKAARRAGLNPRKEQSMRRKPLIAAVLSFAMVLGFPGIIATTANAAVRTNFPEENPGPPTYAFLERPPLGEIFRDGNWVAIPFVRDPSCVPSSFNLLDGADIPGAFGCKLTVAGFAIWKNGPAPIDPVPVFAHYSGLGAGPVWFVSWAELRWAMADDILTIDELKLLPSLLMGTAEIFEAVEQPGLLRPQGFGNGKIEIGAHGTLADGRTFTFNSREMGINQVSVQRHTKIEFK